MDETTGICKAISSKPIIKATFTQDRTTAVEQTFSIDCQVISDTQIKCAQCACFADYLYGYWAGMTCSTCSVGYGKSQCSELCPDYDGETKKSMCAGYGQCLFGSEKSSLERVFQEANCACGQDEQYQPRFEDKIPTASYGDLITQYSWYEPVTNGQTYSDLNSAKTVCSMYNDISVANLDGYCYGVFKRTNTGSSAFEIHMGNTGTEFIVYGLYYKKVLNPATSISYAVEKRELSAKIASSKAITCNDGIAIIENGNDVCNHFNVNSKTCDQCEDTWTGKNCRAKCQKCLLRGTCEGVPDNEALAKCKCPSGTSGLWEHQCCPAGFRVTDLVNWQSLPQSQIDQIKVQKLYDPYTTNDMDSAYFCKKCPGVFSEDWMQAVAAFKVCSGSTRGECRVNPSNQNLICECKLNQLTGNTWRGRACSCDDSIDTAYSSIAASADSTDYGCVIPTGGTAVCPEPNPSGSASLLWYPYMLYAIGRSIDLNYAGTLGSFNKYLGPSTRLSSPLSWNGGIASEISVTTGVHGKCDEETPCHTGEGPCVVDIDCAGALLCNLRVGETTNIAGYDPSRAAAGFKYCYDPLTNLIGCDPIPTFSNFDGSNNFYSYKYWNGQTFVGASTNHYVPMTKDANQNLVIHKRDFPCPKGKYGVVWDGRPECALCPAGYYQDQTGQSTCKSGCGGISLGVISLSHCTTCNAGYEPSVDFQSCIACPTGQYEDGNRNCESCPINNYQLAGVTAQYGNNACNPCPAGTSTQGQIEFIDTTGTGTCLACDDGKYNPSAESSCQNCAAGKYSTDLVASRTTVGFPDLAFTKDMCEEYAARLGASFDPSYSNYAHVAGCFCYSTTNVYWNAAQSSNPTGCADQSSYPCVKNLPYVFAKNGLYDPSVTVEQCREWAGEDYAYSPGHSTYDGGNWADHPRGCLKQKTGRLWYYKSTDSGNNGCDSHSGYKCVKRAKSGHWDLELAGAILHTDIIYATVSNTAACQSKCVDYLYSSMYGSQCRCSNTNYGSGVYSNGGGVYARQTGPKTACTDCAAGKYNAETGQSGCKQCSAGQYHDLVGQTLCKDCQTGRYGNVKGRISCTYCPAGQYQNTIANTGCKCCAKGYYQDQSGSTSCKGPFPQGSTGTGQGAPILGISYSGSYSGSGWNTGNYDLCGIVPNTCQTAPSIPPVYYFKEISSKFTVSWHGSRYYAGWHSSAQACANACYNYASTWIGFGWSPTKSDWSGWSPDCYCQSHGGLHVIKACNYNSDQGGQYDIYSTLICPRPSTSHRSYFDKASHNTCRL